MAHIETHIIVVCDACDDRTRQVAQSHLSPLDTVVTTFEGNVGRARRRGFALAIGRTAGLDARDAWFATTDADSLVPVDWLARQLRWRARGADAVAGTVVVDSWADQPDIVRHRYETRMHELGVGAGHPHVHGANLSFGAATYLESGGFPTVDHAEDVAIWKAMTATGACVVGAPDLPVITSGRRHNRAPQGFSQLLRSLDDPASLEPGLTATPELLRRAPLGSEH